MEPIYRHSVTVDANHVDRFRRLRPSMLLSFVQEAAARHCVLLGADWDTLSQRQLFWAVSRHRVQITRLPSQGETITLETWPMPTTRAAYPRSVVAWDAQGRELFRSISLWVLMDIDSRSMVLPGKSGVDVPGTCTGHELAAPRSLAPMVLQNSTQRTVRFSQLDQNGHMNNTCYLDWLCDLLPSSFHGEHPVREFTVCYLSEALEGQDISLRWELLEGPCLRVDAHRERTDVAGETERIFTAQILF